MGSRRQAEQGGAGGIESERSQPTDAIERQLRDALDSADTKQTEFHLRQALQLVHAFDE
ncbi:hypothetical protein [Haloplanus sp. C73]|uniref:hypothetical protein n=1 Tax=Haloplanus sp. C73 TaxID=3421641 RepID=UPI003EBEE720